MISYFKHTDGEAFTLNGDKYSGFFHVLSGKAYTDKILNVNSQPLVLSPNFITDIFINQYNCNSTYKFIDPLVPYYTNVFDLLNKQGVIDITTAIENNNLKCFKHLIVANPTVFKFEETGGKFYGISSITEDGPTLPAKPTYSDHIEGVSNSSTWAFLDKITSGIVLVDSQENFKYMCTTGTDDYVLSGNFITNVPLEIINHRSNIEFDIHNPVHNTPDYNYYIYQDVENSRIFFVKSATIEIYDSSNFNDCHKLILVDRIALKKSSGFSFRLWNNTKEKFGSSAVYWNAKKFTMFNNNIPEYIRFGKNLKSYLDGSILYLTNKYSSDVYKTIHLTTYNITSVEDLDIRGVDDYVVILHKKNSNRYVTFFDPTDIDGTLTTTLIHSYNFSSLGSHVRFSDFDSDVFYYYSKLEYQTRFISTPTYPSGRLENQDLHFPNKDTFWNTTARLFNLYQRKWNSINAIDTSNKFNLLDASTTIANDKMYMIFVNSGRLYALNQKMNDRYFTTIPLDLEKYFRGVHASDSSIGLYFNSAISQILKDTLNLYTNITSSFILQDYATLILKELETFELDYKNLYINGNETFNVIAFQRIMTTIMNIQSKLMPS